MTCSRCKPKVPCLSHSFLPFGSAWLESDDSLLQKYPERRIRNSDRSFKMDESGRYFFNLKGLSFDECPLGYLDWLGGQPWLRTGIFKTRLFKYLRHDCIQRELENLFPDPEDDSRKPVFSALDGFKDRWHGQIRQKEDTDRSTDNEFVFTMTKAQAWEVLADFLDLDLDETDIGTALEAMLNIRKAVKLLFLSQNQLDTIRSKYRAVRAMARRCQLSRIDTWRTPDERLFELLQNSH